MGRLLTGDNAMYANYHGEDINTVNDYCNCGGEACSANTNNVQYIVTNRHSVGAAYGPFNSYQEANDFLLSEFTDVYKMTLVQLRPVTVETVTQYKY